MNILKTIFEKIVLSSFANQENYQANDLEKKGDILSVNFFTLF